jgi:DNA-binding winged helix-turn-helix (wHTH) protein
METFTPPPSDIVRFGTFEVNLRTGELRKRGIRIALQEQPLRILSVLLDRAGEVVSREDLCTRLWPHGTYVDFEHSLNAAVRRLRVTLGDEAEVPRFIETVHKRGYRFIALNDVFPRTANPGGRPASPATIAHIVRKRARLAVLPFGPFDGFTHGLTEEAISQLAQSCPRNMASSRARRSNARSAKVAVRQKLGARSAPTTWSKAACGVTAIGFASQHS